MSTSGRIRKPKRVFYLWLVVILLACWWIGWRDYDPYMAQELVRENIRTGIRGMIQISIQYIVPVAILVYFTSEFFNSLSSRQERKKDDIA